MQARGQYSEVRVKRSEEAIDLSQRLRYCGARVLRLEETMPQPAKDDDPGKSKPNPADARAALAARIWPPVFALLCLTLALTDTFHFKGVEVKPIALALLVLATAPWSLPWFASLVASLKVGDVTLEFRQLKQELKEQQAIVGSIAELGVGGMVASSSSPEVQGMVSHAGSAAPDRGASVAQTASDRFSTSSENSRSKPVASGRKLSAEVKTFPGSNSLFMVHATVVSTDASKPLRDDTPVVFGLPTFATPTVEKAVKDGVATLDCLARGPFTLSAELEDLTLALDLARDVPYLPPGFASR